MSQYAGKLVDVDRLKVAYDALNNATEKTANKVSWATIAAIIQGGGDPASVLTENSYASGNAVYQIIATLSDDIDDCNAAISNISSSISSFSRYLSTIEANRRASLGIEQFTLGNNLVYTDVNDGRVLTLSFYNQVIPCVNGDIPLGVFESAIDPTDHPNSIRVQTKGKLEIPTATPLSAGMHYVVYDSTNGLADNANGRPVLVTGYNNVSNTMDVWFM